jgi:hypothetical protein
VEGRERPKSDGGDGTRERRFGDIQKFAASGSIQTEDDDLTACLFLYNHDGWKPDDLGYPVGDLIIIDLMRELDRQAAAVRKAMSV